MSRPVAEQLARLRRIEDLFDQKREVQLAAWKREQAEFERVDEDRRSIQQMGATYRTELNERNGNGLAAGELKHWIGFIGQLDRGVEAKEREARLLEQRVAAAEAKLLSARQRVAAMGKLVDRTQVRATQDSARKEQRVADEIAQQMHRRSKLGVDGGHP